MLTPKILVVLLILWSTSLWAQPNCVDETHCRSQLLRVEINNSIFQNSAQSLLPALQTFSASPVLPSLIERSFPLPIIPFPQNAESCLREKQTNPLFANINCSDRGLCGRADLNAQVRELMCFRLPCSLFEGTLHTGSCGSTTYMYPNEVSFPTPITIQKIRMTPTRVEFSGNRANLCFNINELSLNMSVRLGLDTRGTQIPDNALNVGNINPLLDGPRNVCVTADVNIGAANPVSNLVVTSPDGTPFISDEMIRSASRGLTISGLSGYPADQIERIKAELVPVIVQPLRDTVEDSIRKSLADVFQTQINTLASQGTGSSSHLVSGQNLASELGLGNLQIRDRVSILECAVLKNSSKPIPPDHACVGLPYYGGPITPENFSSPTINELMNLRDTARNAQITSESLKQRLLALKPLMLDEPMYGDDPNDHSDFAQRSRVAHRQNIQQDIAEYIDPIVDSISTNQLNSQIFNFVEIQNQLSNGSSRNVGVSIPEICSDRNPSPHARREMRNCPIQAYVDLNEFNQVLSRMWSAGRLCQQGRGAYVPTLEGGQQKYDPEGKPIGSGCYMEVGGMGCYMNNPPQIRYDARTRKYKTSIHLKACYRPPAFLGIGRFGGDFNIDFSFSPKACNGGDFCMDKPDVNWSVVPGTERFSLRPGGFLTGIVTEGIQSAVNGAISNTIRIPLTSNVGPLAGIPLEAEGRTDSGPGFFGACLRLRSTSGVTGQ